MEQQKRERIFLVDDNQMSLQLYRHHLTNQGYSNVRCFSSGTTCLDAIMEVPDVVFLDYGMEVLNGIEVLRKIKRFNPDIYVVFISGQDDVRVAVKSMKYGALDYIVKGDGDCDRMTLAIEKVDKLRKMVHNRRKKFLGIL